ncbi:MAG TPA: cytochrome c [Hyphomicrobiaceae bacterium]|nr:cytochrome c [Hyphomicrobiaceae bacterium]
MRIFVLFFAVISATAAAGPCAAQDAAAGRQKAILCQACHGLDGLAKIPGAPNLAGQVKDYLVKAMTDYKTGARKNEMMSVLMQQVSDADIELLASYYASLTVPAKPAQ